MPRDKTVTDLTILAGSLDLAGYTVQVGGNYSNSGAGSLVPNGGTVDFTAAAGIQTVDSGGTGDGKTFFRLRHSGAGTLRLVNEDVKISGKLILDDGSIDLSGRSIDVNVVDVREVGIQEGINLVDPFGTVNAAPGTYGDVAELVKSVTVNFTGTTNVDGAFDVFGLSCDTPGAVITFKEGLVQTVRGALTLKGTPDNLLVLKSAAGGVQWSIDPQGVSSVEGVDVRDSVNLSSSYLVMYPPNSIDGGNNINWFEPQPVVTYGNAAKQWVPLVDNYIVNPWIAMPPMRPIGNNIALAADVVNIGVDEDLIRKYKKKYAPGFYKTIVISLHGIAMVMNYDEKRGPDYKNAAIIANGRTSRSSR